MPDKAVVQAAQETAGAAKAKADEIAVAGIPEKAPMFNSGFFKTVLITVVSFLIVSLGSYFIWLGTAVIGMDKKLDSVATNVESLLETRTSQANESTARTARRVEQLERDAEEGN